MEKEKLVKVISDSIENVVGKTNININENLFSGNINISPIDMVYIIDLIEEIIQFSIARIFISDYKILTINNIADSILEIIN